MKAKRKILIISASSLLFAGLVTWGITSTVLLAQKEKKNIEINNNNTNAISITNNNTDLVYENSKWQTSKVDANLKNSNSNALNWYEVTKNSNGSYNLGNFVNSGASLNFTISNPTNSTYYFVAEAVVGNQFLFSNLVTINALQNTLGTILQTEANSYNSNDSSLYFTKPETNNNYNVTLNYNNAFNELNLGSGYKLATQLLIPYNSANSSVSYWRQTANIKNNEANFSLNSNSLNEITNNWADGEYASFVGQFFFIENSSGQIVAKTNFIANITATFYKNSFANSFIISNNYSNGTLTLQYNNNLLANMGTITANYTIMNTNDDVLASGSYSMNGSVDTVTANISNTLSSINIISSFKTTAITYFSNSYLNGTNNWTITNTINL